MPRSIPALATLPLLLAACGAQEPPAVAEAPTPAPVVQMGEPTTVAHPVDLSEPVAEMALAESANPPLLLGRFTSDSGQVAVYESEGVLGFDLLVVNSQGHTGEASGALKAEEGVWRYAAPAIECRLDFHFSEAALELVQVGECAMGLGVNGSGSYYPQLPPPLLGSPGDTLGSLFYGADEATYRAYCVAGMEELSGKLLCNARLATGEDTAEWMQLFAGDYAGPDGELPPLAVARTFTLVETR